MRKPTAVKDLAPLLTGMLQRGTRSTGEPKPTAAGDVDLLLGEGTGKIVASEDFAAFLFMISSWSLIRISCHCRRGYQYTSMRICICHKLSVCGNASG